MGRTLGDLSPINKFLSLPEMKPALEFLDGRVIQKMSPMLPRSVIQGELLDALNRYARPRKIGRAFPELRAVFGGAAQVPDIAFYITERLPRFVRGQEAPLITTPPDLSVEILSKGQSARETRRKIRHALKHGSQSGWLIDPTTERVQVMRPGAGFEILKVGDVLRDEILLPGFELSLEELFGWLDED